MTITRFLQEPGGWTAHLFNDTSEALEWCRRNPGNTLLPEANMTRGRYHGSEDHRNDWLNHVLNEDDK
jgi:hypothetical protein